MQVVDWLEFKGVARLRVRVAEGVQGKGRVRVEVKEQQEGSKNRNKQFKKHNTRKGERNKLLGADIELTRIGDSEVKGETNRQGRRTSRVEVQFKQLVVLG